MLSACVTACAAWQEIPRHGVPHDKELEKIWDVTTVAFAAVIDVRVLSQLGMSQDLERYRATPGLNREIGTVLRISSFDLL